MMAEYSMLKHNQYCHLFQYRIYGILFVLFLVLFTIYPILDAYADSLNYSSATMDVADDSLDTSKQITRGHHTSPTPFNGLFLPALAIIDNSALTISQKGISSNEIKSHQSYPPLSSDLSPPLA
jgi:hypothetical protein